MIGLWLVLVGQSFFAAEGISEYDLYQHVTQNGDFLRRGANEYDIFKLDSPLQFYSEKYDHVYVSCHSFSCA